MSVLLPMVFGWGDDDNVWTQWVLPTVALVGAVSVRIEAAIVKLGPHDICVPRESYLLAASLAKGQSL